LAIDRPFFNPDSRRCVFVHCHGRFRALMIDLGYYFNRPHWDVHDRDFVGLLPGAWLSRAENMHYYVLAGAVDATPAEWLASKECEPLARLIRAAHQRSCTLRSLLTPTYTLASRVNCEPGQ
jgi:hypothetical protein